MSPVATDLTRVAETWRAYLRAYQEARAARATAEQAIVEAFDAGASVADIAAHTSVSRQQIYKVLAARHRHAAASDDDLTH